MIGINSEGEPILILVRRRGNALLAGPIALIVLAIIKVLITMIKMSVSGGYKTKEYLSVLALIFLPVITGFIIIFNS